MGIRTEQQLRAEIALANEKTTKMKDALVSAEEKIKEVAELSPFPPSRLGSLAAGRIRYPAEARTREDGSYFERNGTGHWQRLCL